ncbi:MAG: EEP domain-containing protein, partial [Epsilonproteobacteria bacterium]|nr:EEP domain-containing protein [Campylobacterota bacterium]
MPTHTHHTSLPNSFSLLCWNVHKEMGQKKFNQTFHQLQQQYNPNLILFQEAVLNASTHQQFAHHAYETATNIKTWRNAFGVLTASQSSFHKKLSLKTIHRELHMTTKKSLLITSHPLENGETLTVVNLHAIN